MYCKNCGKDIGDAKYCQYCGNSNDNNTGNTNVTINLIPNDIIVTVKDKINQIGHEKIIRAVAVISTIISIIIRIVNNEVLAVYKGFVYDDYYVVSASGRTYMLIVIALQIIISALLYNDARKNQHMVTKGTIVLSVVLLAIQIIAMMLRLPAPY